MLEGKRILVVDGDDAYVRVVVEALQKVGARPVSVKSAEEALSVLGQEEFDLLLTDLRLPQMNGYELCRMLASMPRFASMPVVAASVNPFINSINIAICPNVVDFLRKPFRSEELLETLIGAITGKPRVLSRLVRRRA